MLPPLFTCHRLTQWVAAASLLTSAANLTAMEVNLPAQDLGRSLRQLANQANVQIYYAQDHVANRAAPALQGDYSLDEALKQLLNQYDLVYQRLEGGAIAIQPQAGPVESRVSPRESAITPPATSLEEVIVTARKQAETIQDAPISVTAFSSGSIDSAQLTNLTEIGELTPNLNFSLGQSGGSSSVQAFIRGIGEADYMLTTDPAVGLYIDGVYIARTSGANVGLSDIEQVEILRGPQGTLFGKNSIGGAINLTTRVPDGSTSGQLEASVGRFDYRALKGYLQMPITDQIAAGLAFSRERSEGWQKRPTGGNGGEVDRLSARLTLAWTPTDSFSSVLSTDYTDQDQAAYANVILDVNPNAPVLGAYRNAGAQPPCCETNSRFRSNADNPLARDDVLASGATWTNTWETSPSLTFKSITAYREVDADFGHDYDHSPARVYAFGDETTQRQWSQEFQFLGDAFDGRLEWLAGLYWFKEKGSDFSTLEVAPEAVASSLLFDLNILSHNRQTSESRAAFVHANWHVTDRLTIYGGLRYTWEEKQYEKDGFRAVTGSPQFPPFTNTAGSDCSATGSASAGSPFSCKADWTASSPKLGLSYSLTEDMLIYAHVARGFRSGGFNGRPTELSLITSYDPEYLTSYELGFKGEWLDHRLRSNMAIYYNDYSDKQQTVNVDAGSSGVFLTVNNAGEARIQGFEIESSALLGAGFQVNLGLGYTDAEFIRWDDAVEGDLTHRALPHAPEWTGNLALQHTLSLGSWGELLSRIDASYKDDTWLDAENSEALLADSYWLMNASIRYINADGKWEATLSGKNLTDEKALASGFDGANFFGIIHGNYIAPRSWQLSLRYLW